MKICFVGDATSIHVKKWARWFVNRGHELHLISDKPDEIKGVKLHMLSTKLGARPFMKKAFQTKKIIRQLKPDIVHGHFVLGYGTWAAYSGFHPLVLSAWGSDIAREPTRSRTRKAIVKWTLKRSDITLIGDEHTKKRLTGLGINSDKLIINNWGVNNKLFNPENRTLDIRKKLGIESHMVLSVNSWTAIYCIDVLLKAVPNVLKEMKDVKFVLLGGGLLESELKALAKNLGVEKNVIFVGRVPLEEVARYFTSADLLVDTFDIGLESGGGIGIANLEAMACGTPLLIEEREYLRKIGKSVVDEPLYCNPLAYEPKDPRDLAAKIVTLLRDENLREEIARKEIEAVKKIGSWDENMLKVEYIYKKLVNKK